MKTVLTIAGSDSSGGAGVGADIKTITAHGLHAANALTAVTAQNSTGVSGIFDVPPEFIAKQIDCTFTDLYPDAVKIGMLSNAESIKIITERLQHYNVRNIVLDTVMSATAGGCLLKPDSVDTLIGLLSPVVFLITPNIDEAAVISGIRITSKSDMITAAKIIADRSKTNVLIKGGHLSGGFCDDFLLHDNNEIWFNSVKIDSSNTRGTGCILSSAIASNLALGYNLAEAVGHAKEYIEKVLKDRCVI